MKAEQRKKERMTMCEQRVYWQKWQRAQNNQNIINLQSIFYRDNGVVAIDSIICHVMSHHNLKVENSRTYTVHTQSAMRTIRFSQRHSFESSVHKVLPWVEVEILVLRDVIGNNKRSKVSNSLSRRDRCICIH